MIVSFQQKKSEKRCQEIKFHPNFFFVEEVTDEDNSYYEVCFQLLIYFVLEY